MCSLTTLFSPLQSLTLPSSSFSTNLEPKLSTSSVSFPLKMKTRIYSKSLVPRVKAYGSSINQPSDSSAEFTLPSGNLVVDAMRQTVTSMIGTLPPQFFAVTVTSVAENLAQLMMSVLMTGYMFRNAQYRLELQQSLDQVALPQPPRDQRADDQDYAPGTQKNVSGEVIRWNNISGPEKIDARKYIELLEAEIEQLNRQVGRKSELTSTAGEDVAVAMNAFIKRLLAVSDTDPKQMKTNVTETSATDLAKLLYWLMVVGYSIRNIEVRFDMERVLGTQANLAVLPPGENI
ncbi:hypothetical protein Bca4012_013853 [Brassica carinata]